MLPSPCPRAASSEAIAPCHPTAGGPPARAEVSRDIPMSLVFENEAAATIHLIPPTRISSCLNKVRLLFK